MTACGGGRDRSVCDRHLLRASAAMQASVTAALWHSSSFGTAPGRLVLVKEAGSARPYDLAIFTLDTATSAEAAIERYAWRWAIGTLAA